MDVTSEEIRSSRFQGTRHVYDRREVDAFLHRTAATLEIFERKLAVTESHVESLEKALDLANSRARSVRERDVRIGELEAALAATQHNYELEVDRGDGVLEATATPSTDHVAQAQAEAAELLAKAQREADALREDAETLRTEAAEKLAALQVKKDQQRTMAAENEVAAKHGVDVMLATARRQEAKMQEDLAQARAAAMASLEKEIGEMRTAAEDEAAQIIERIRDESAAADAELTAQLEYANMRASNVAAKSQTMIQQAEERANAAETDRDEVLARLAEVESAARAAAAERSDRMKAEQSAKEVLAEAEAERNDMLVAAQARIDESAAEQAALIAIATSEADDLKRSAEEEVLSLRRKAAQMRTALASLQESLSSGGDISAPDIEIAAALADLDLDDLADVVDLTHARNTGSTTPSSSGEPRKLKSKWSQPATAAPRGVVIDLETAEGPAGDGESTANGDAPATWRDKVAPARPVKVVADEEPATSLGFYERRLAGLRARLEEAAPIDD